MEKRLTRKKAIREKCLDCCCGSAHEVRLCPAYDCPLYRYRLGCEVEGDGFTPVRANKTKNHAVASKSKGETGQYAMNDKEEE